MPQKKLPTELISIERFICQVALVEELNIHIVNAPSVFMIEPYKYVTRSRAPIYTLAQLKEKRLNKYLKDFDYYFFNKDIRDIFPDSSLVACCRELTKEDKSLITCISGIVKAHSK
jgi:hypothetical protein